MSLGERSRSIGTDGKNQVINDLIPTLIIKEFS